MAKGPTHQKRLAVGISKIAVAFSEGRGASVGDLLKLADELCIPSRDLEKLRFDDAVCQEVERLVRVRALYLLAFALGPIGDMAKTDTAAFKALAKIAGFSGGPLVQFNTANFENTLSDRLKEPESAKHFIENFRRDQRNGAVRVLGEGK